MFYEAGRFFLPYICNPETDAQVAKLVDALCSGRSVSNHVLVRIQSWAQAVLTKSEWLFCFCEASLLARANKQKRQAMRSIGKRLRAAHHPGIGEANPVLGTNAFPTKLERRFYFEAWQVGLPKPKNENDETAAGGQGFGEDHISGSPEGQSFPGHKCLSNEVGEAFLFMSVEGLLSKSE